MGCCTGRCFMITLCVIQMVATVERQVFDFLGYMWAPIIVNFLQIIFVICGFFGTLQYRPKVVLTYTIWSVLWIGWNIFIICFYLEVGILKRDMPILTLGTDNKSWWYDHGFDCQVNQNSSSTSPFNSLVGRQVPDEGSVTGCLLQYYYVEVIHAGIQCLLAAIGFCVSCHVVRVFTEEDDSSQPVHDELEYIKMRYRSPARNSFRTNKAYETLSRPSTYTASSVDNSFERHYDDDSADHYHGDKKLAHKDRYRKSGHAFDPDTGQTQLDELAFSISGHTPGLTVV